MRHGHVINGWLEGPMQQISSNPRQHATTQTTRRRALGVRARDERRLQAAERRASRKRHRAALYWDGDEWGELYLGFGDV
ncbi:hypothetical protein AB0O47_16810 [Streptomyces noursei]|uniref:hypothetical protein n=1 Tax=Streptomyces noursei TaxID=1971 RepID=UPI00344D0E85